MIQKSYKNTRRYIFGVNRKIQQYNIKNIKVQIPIFTYYQWEIMKLKYSSDQFMHN